MKKLSIAIMLLVVLFFQSINFQYISAEIPSFDTAKLRFSQNFFTIFTLIPLFVIGLGSLIIFYGMRERKIRKNTITKKLIIIGSIVIFLGFIIFDSYLID